MANVVRLAPCDTVLITIGNDIDLDEYQAISNHLSEKLGTSNIILMPEYAVKDITVFKKELSGTSNMFLDGGYIYEKYNL